MYLIKKICNNSMSKSYSFPYINVMNADGNTQSGREEKTRIRDPFLNFAHPAATATNEDTNTNRQEYSARNKVLYFTTNNY